jgi:hypothetical protein
MPDTPADVEDATALEFVGEATAAVLAESDVSPADVAAGTVSYEALVEVGVNAGVAARIRRAHSLPWAIDHTSGERLRRRSEHVHNLRDDEKAWVAESADGWADDATADGGRTAEEAERAWRESAEDEDE